DRIGEAAQQHEQRQHEIHDADALVIDGGQPLAPQVRHVTLQSDPGEDCPYAQDHAARGAHDDRLVERDCAPGELAEEIHRSALSEAVEMHRDGSSADISAVTMLPNRPGATAR